MLAHFLGVLALIGSALLVVVGLGVTLFGLARGDRLLTRRAGLGTLAYLALYLLGIVLSVALAPRQVLPHGSELSFCGFDCHLHISIVETDAEDDRIGIVVRARNDARQELEHPRYLQFRVVDREGNLLVPDQDGKLFPDPIPAGTAQLDTLSLVVPLDKAPYSLRVIYPDIPEALLLGPANRLAAGKTTLSIE